MEPAGAGHTTRANAPRHPPACRRARPRRLAATCGVRGATMRRWRALWTYAPSQLGRRRRGGRRRAAGGVIQQVWHEAPRRGRPAPFTPEPLGPRVGWPVTPRRMLDGP